jgi:hypothetical protein
MKPINRYNIQNAKDSDEAIRWISHGLKSFFEILNSGITFNDNFDSSTQTVVFSDTNTEKIIDHGLGRVPVGYFKIGSSVALTIYDSGTTWTKKKIFLKSDTIGTAKVIIF